MARHVFLLLQLALLLLLHTSSTHSSHAQAAIAEENGSSGVGMGSMMRALGSRPPSCEGRCSSSCGRRCEAVQVPVTPQDLPLHRKRKSPAGGGGSSDNGDASGPGRTAPLPLPSSYDDHSNYKPLGWRCKCLLS